MRSILTYILLMILFSAQGQDQARKIVKEYRRGEGPTELNNGLGFLNTETHYDKEGRTIKQIQFGDGYMSSEVRTNYYLGSKPKSITYISYPKGFWPGTISLQNLSANHPDRKPDTMVQQNIYNDTLLIRSDSYRNGKLSGWTEYTYNNAGYEIELISFNGTRENRGRWLKTSRDQNNRPIKIEEINWDGSVNYTEMKTYDTSGLLKRKEYKSRDISYNAVTKYTYNSSGLVIKEIQEVLLPKDRKELTTLLFEYNEIGLLITELVLDSLGKETWRKVHEYNSVGQKIKTKFNEHVYYYGYNKNGDLISMVFEDSRSEIESTQLFIYESGLLRKTEHYNRNELTYFTQNYYSNSGKLIRQEPMPIKGQEALDWIKYFDYNEKGQLIRLNHKQPGSNLFNPKITTYTYNSKKPQSTPIQPKPDPYKNYVDQFTYYTYDLKGRILNQYEQGGDLTQITQIDSGKYVICQNHHDAFGMPSMSIQYLENLDTLKIEMRGELKIITLKLDYVGSSFSNSYEPKQYYHKNLIREETRNEKGEMIALKEITEDGILIFSSDKNETKTIGTHTSYTPLRVEVYSYGRFSFNTMSTTLYTSDSLKYLETNMRNDSIKFSYKNGQLVGESKKYGSGYFNLTRYEYDKNGFKTLERNFKLDGTENSRIIYKNDGKHIVSEQRIHVYPNQETVYEIIYLNP